MIISSWYGSLDATIKPLHTHSHYKPYTVDDSALHLSATSFSFYVSACNPPPLRRSFDQEPTINRGRIYISGGRLLSSLCCMKLFLSAEHLRHPTWRRITSALVAQLFCQQDSDRVSELVNNPQVLLIWPRIDSLEVNLAPVCAESRIGSNESVKTVCQFLWTN